MPRRIRVEFEDAYYHVMARGNERRAIFRSDRDRNMFLKTMRQMLQRFGARMPCYCLMPNHYHWILHTPLGNLSRCMAWFQTTYTVRFNRKHKRSGHLFQGRYRAHLIEADQYAVHLVRYIHLNPIRPKDRNAPIPNERLALLNDYQWSSHRYYSQYQRWPDWLCNNWLKYWGETLGEAHLEYRKDIARFCQMSVNSPWQDARGGIVLGSEDLWQKVEDSIGCKQDDESLRWREEQNLLRQRRRVSQHLEQELDPKVKIWLRVCLGAERSVDVAKEYGYSHGGGVLQVIKRLEQRAEQDIELAAKLVILRKSVQCAGLTP